ncbi:MAG: FtsX-like permease family protein [Candidatus Thorarchaeota archaeon]
MFLFSRLSAKAPQVITTLLIFALSSGVLGGILFYMDSTAPTVLNDMTANVPIDMEVSFGQRFYVQNQSDPSYTSVDDIRDIVESQDYVLNTEPLTFVDIYDWYAEDYLFSRRGFLGINSTSLANFPRAIEFESGSLSYDNDSCLVEKDLFLSAGLQIGENYTLNITVETYFDGNYSLYTVEKEFVVKGTFTSSIYMFQPYWDGPEVTYLHLITTQEILEELFYMLPHDEWYGIQNRIWVEFDRLGIIQNNPQTMIETLDNVKKQIEQETLPFGIIEYDSFKLQEAVYEFAIWSLSIRAVAIAFSIPSIIMGIMLIQYNSKLLADEQRRDVGTIKTRGSSGLQAFSWVLSSALTTGIIGSIGAVFTGILASIVSGSVRELLVFNLDQLSGFVLLLQPTAVIIVFSFSFVAGLVVALPAAVKALLMTPTEAHAVLEGEILTESEEMGSPAVDILVVFVSGYLFLLLMFVFAFGGLTTMASTFFAATIIPMMGIFLYFFTRMLSRGTSVLKSRILSQFKRPSLVVGTKLLSRTTRLFKKSEAIGTMFVAMVFTAGLFSSLSATTGDTHMKHVFYFETGADIAIEVDSGLTNVTIDLIQNITAVEGVARVSPMIRITGYVQYYNAYEYGGGIYLNRSVSVYGVQPDTWVQTAFWLDYFTLQNSPRVSIPRLNETLDGEINVITTFKPIAHYTIDSFTNMRIPEYSPYLNLQVFSNEWYNETACTIVDIMASNLDEYGQVTYLPGETDVASFLIMDLSLLHNWINSTHVSKFYVDLEPRANYTQAMTEIYQIAPYSFTKVEAASEFIDEVLDSRATQSVFGAYTLNVIFTLIYLTFGMVIVTTVKVRNLRRQFSVLRALGADTKSMVVASLADTTVGLLLSALIGGAIGGLLAYLLKSIPLLYMGLSTTQLWRRLPVRLIIPWTLLSEIVGVAVAVSLIATYVVVTRALKQNIAEEIQYTG